MANRVTIISIIFSLAVAITVWLFVSPVVNGNTQDEYLFTITPGMSFNHIMTKLQEAKILAGNNKPKLAAWVMGVQNSIKAGKYKIRGGASSYQLLSQLSEGRVTSEWVTIPEGLQAREIASILARKVAVDSVVFMQLIHDSALVQQFSLEGKQLEGYLFPNTYNFLWGLSAKNIIRTMLNEFNKQVNDSLKEAIKNNGMTLLETLTLASIIEGEAVVDSERALISAVYHNRLQRGMLLQADPTIQYIIEDGPRRLLNKDLKIKSPYNTYIYKGLPPGPINNPGLGSIIAALHPANVRYFYFVANGDGSHTFSKTLRQHNRAKARFDKLRKKNRRKQRRRRK